MLRGKLSKRSGLSAGSLFSCIGGFCRGFQEAGFEVVWANEVDDHARKTYEANFDTNLIAESITDISVSDDILEPVDVLTAGFPCQPFSIAGDKNGFEDQRGNLFFEITRLVREFGSKKPKIIVLENVKNFLKFDDGKALLRVTKELRECGYWFGTDIPNPRHRHAHHYSAKSRTIIHGSFKPGCI